MMKKKDTGEDGHADSDPKFAPHRRGQKGVVAGKNPAPDSIEDRRIRDEIHRKKREHTLKNYQIMIEYKHLKQHVPPGIYILPSFTPCERGVGSSSRGLELGSQQSFALRSICQTTILK